jgi:hypothetical protein
MLGSIAVCAVACVSAVGFSMGFYSVGGCEAFGHVRIWSALKNKRQKLD